MNDVTKHMHRGVRNLGYVYEELVPAYFALKLLQDHKVKNFKFVLNSSPYGKFDDLNIEIQHTNNHSVKLSLQLKHRDEGRDVLQVDEFYRKGKNFEIELYCKNFDKLPPEVQEGYKFVLFTNTKFEKLEESRGYKIRVVCNPFGTSCFDLDNILQFEETRQHLSHYGDKFFQNFYLFSGQKNVEELIEAINQIFEKDFHSNEKIAICYMHFFGDLRKKLYSNTEIDRDGVILKLLDLFLDDFTITPSLRPQTSEKQQLLEDALQVFDITLLEKFQGALNNCHNDEATLKVKQLAKDYKLIKEHKGVTEKMYCYFLGKPLFVKFNQGVNFLVTISMTMVRFQIRFVLVGPSDNFDPPKRCKVFTTLIDLQKWDPLLYQNLVTKFKVTLQGRQAVTLDTFKAFDLLVTPTQLFESVDNDLCVGTTIEPLPTPFISRFLTRSSINYSYLKLVCQRHIITVHCNGLMQRFKSFLKTHDFDIDIDNGLVLTDATQNQDQFYHLKLVNDNFNSFEWTLRKLNPDLLELFDNQLNVICGNPGIGKTTIVKYLAHRCPLDYWVANIPLKKLSQFLQEGGHLVDEILDNFLHSKCEFDQKVINHFKGHKKLMFFFDGLDELSGGGIEGTIGAIKMLLKEGYKCWISCTKRLKQLLDDRFYFYFVYDIEELEKEDQVKYIEKKLKDVNKTQDYVNKVIEGIFNYGETDILSLPLCLFLVTEIVSSLDEVNKLEDYLTLSKMYSSFVDAKLQHKLTKANINQSTITTILNILKDFYIEECKVGALKTCLEPQHFELLQIKSHDVFLKHVRENGDVLGFIIEVNADATFVFIHNTIAQYFAACWLSENYQKIPMEQRKFLFLPQYVGIRYFLNLKLSEDFPLHLAILNRNVAKVKELSQKHLQDVDKGGRTPLHLASSIEIKLSNCQEIITCKNEAIEDDQILKCLLAKDVNILTKDKLFGWNSFEYADASKSLSSLEELSKKETLQLSHLTNYRELQNLTQKCVISGCINLLQRVIQWKPLEELDKTQKPLLHLALENNQTEIAEFLIEQLSDLEKIDCDKQTALHKAAIWNYTNIVKLLLKKEVNNKPQDGQKLTPLHFAAKRGYIDIVKELIKHGTDFDVLDRRRRTPLHKACYTGKTEVVQYLLQKGAAVTFKDHDEKTPLQRAAVMGHYDTVKCLVEHQANLKAIDKNKRTALHYAAFEGHKKVVQYLIEEKINVFIEDDDGKTAQDLSEERGYEEIVTMLKEAASVCTQAQKTYHCDLHEAAHSNNLSKIKHLLSEDYDVEDTDDDNQTILHIAALEGHAPLVTYLLEQKADKSAKNRDGRIPLHLASQRGHAHIVTQLITEEHVNATDKWKLTPLHRAAFKGHKEVVEILTSAGASLGAQQSRGGTPLYSAALGGHKDIISLLYSKGAEIEAKNYFGETCLHGAAFKGCEEVAAYVIDNWKNVIDFVDKQGRTALHWAAEKGCGRMVQYLVNAGASLQVVDVYKKTPLDYAMEGGKEDIVVYLKAQKRG